MSNPQSFLWSDKGAQSANLFSVLIDFAGSKRKSKMPLFGKKDSGKKVRKDGHKDIDKQIINIEDKYHLRQVLGK